MFKSRRFSSTSTVYKCTMRVVFVIPSAESKECKNTHSYHKFSHKQIQLLVQIFVRTMTLPKKCKEANSKAGQRKLIETFKQKCTISPPSMFTQFHLLTNASKATGSLKASD